MPAVQRLLAEQVDMQFADLRALFRLPSNVIAPKIGCNLTAAAMLCNQISGFSIWFFHARYAQTLQREEQRRGFFLSRRRFLGFVRAYYPRVHIEPRADVIAEKLYDTRNLLAHNLGVGDIRPGSRRREVNLIKPDPPLAAEDVVDLERQVVYPLAGAPVQRVGMGINLFIPGLYWAVGRCFGQR